MRHLVAGRKLNRTSAHRQALLRNLAQSLFEHEQVRTTLPKAKELRRFAEKLITLARKAHGGDLAALQRLISKISDRAIIPDEHREAYQLMSTAGRHKVLRARTNRRHRSGEPRPGLSFTAESVIHRLVHTVAPRYADRPGGYTRIIKLATTRIGDSSSLAILQLVGSEKAQSRARASGTLARRKRAARRQELAKQLDQTAKPPAQRERPSKAKPDPEAEPPPQQPSSADAQQDQPAQP
jgi:large subunit ribosomal protein L17